MNDLGAVRLAAAEAGDLLQRVIDMMIDGVAFPEDSLKSYTIISHEGDYLGTAPSTDVQFAVHYMKRKGRQIGTIPSTLDDKNKRMSHPGMTFAWTKSSLDI
jgi:hypothetical protein